MVEDTPTSLLRGRWPQSVSRPVATPIYPSVVYASDDPDALDAQYGGHTHGYTYAREGHPNADVLALHIDRLEGASGGVVTGSGMAAITAAVMGSLRAGDHVIGGDQLYGRTSRLLTEDLPRLGISTSLVDTTRVDAVAAAMRPETRMVLVEVVTNPGLRIADLAGIAALTVDKCLFAVDNTFTTPRAIRPFEHGADIVIHSVTKLLSGHSDATLGYVAAGDKDLADRIRTFSVTCGMTPSPFDCWLAERGIYTFPLRFDQAEQSAIALADLLSSLPGVTRVLYPGREDHPDSGGIATKLLNRSGNMVTFEIAGGRRAANMFVRAAAPIPFAPTLGDIGTTISHPASSSHRSLSDRARAMMGITEGLFRISTGLEPTLSILERFKSAIDASQL